MLTPRETEILGLVAEGRSNRSIAKVLRVSDATVRSHVYHVLMKLGLGDRAQALDRTADYVADNPIPPHLLTPGTRVAVPLWIKGEVDSWTCGEVLHEQGVGPEPYYVVRLNDGQECQGRPNLGSGAHCVIRVRG